MKNLVGSKTLDDKRLLGDTRRSGLFSFLRLNELPFAFRSLLGEIKWNYINFQSFSRLKIKAKNEKRGKNVPIRQTNKTQWNEGPRDGRLRVGDVELDSKKKFCRFGERENGKLFHFETVKFTRRKKEKSWKDVAPLRGWMRRKRKIWILNNKITVLESSIRSQQDGRRKAPSEGTDKVGRARDGWHTRALSGLVTIILMRV